MLTVSGSRLKQRLVARILWIGLACTDFHQLQPQPRAGLSPSLPDPFPPFPAPAAATESDEGSMLWFSITVDSDILTAGKQASIAPP
jgi:hypothetical protein